MCQRACQLSLLIQSLKKHEIAFVVISKSALELVMALINIMVLLIVYVFGCLRVSMQAPVKDNWDIALPFQRILQLEDPPMEGDDVVILQNLLQRFSRIGLDATGLFDRPTSKVLTKFQQSVGLNYTGILDIQTGAKVIEYLMSDNYKDDQKIPSWCKYKFYVPVYRNRSIETNATLYGGDGTVLYRFRVRAKGDTKPSGQEINQLTTNGDTPTGLMTFDLNTRQPKAFEKQFGPYPILRCVKGLKGNAAISKNPAPGHLREPFITNNRFGILLHTGEWPDWHAGMPMPNSLGCMKTSMDDMERITDILIKKLNVIANPNTYGHLPYPYKPQGIISIEQID